MSPRTVVEGTAPSPGKRWQFLRLVLEEGRIASLEARDPIAGEFGPPSGFENALEGTKPTPWVTVNCDGRQSRFAGAVILPLFVDAHTHLLGVGLGLLRPNLGPALSSAEALALLADWLRLHPGDGPVIAEGWDQSRWSGEGYLTGLDLDRLGSSRPIAARRVCGHIAALNGPALASLGRDWPGLDVATGLATEELPLSLGRLWPPSREELDAATEAAQEEALRHGVGWIHEMGDRSTWSAFRRAEEAGRLRVRVSHYFRCEGAEALDAMRQLAADLGVRKGAGVAGGPGDGAAATSEFADGPRLRFAGIKLFLDGSFGARTAALRQPYPEGGHGRLLWEDERLAEAVRFCRERDWPIAVHAIGDQAVEQLIAVLERTGTPGSVPPRVEHAEMLPADLAGRAAALGLTFSMQPNFTANWQGRGELYEQVLGWERACALNPYVRAAAAGPLVFGSDTMPLGPVWGLRGALHHPDPEERLDLGTALHAYTVAGAAAVVRPFHGACLAVGEPADLAILALPAVPGPDDGPAWSLRATIVGGAVRLLDAGESA